MGSIQDVSLFTEANLLSFAIALIFALGLVAIPLWMDRGALTAIIVSSLGAAQILVGHAIVDEFLGDSFWPTYAIGAYAFLAGYYAGSGRYRKRVWHASGYGDVSYKTARGFTLLISFFVGYHFLIGGVPLFSKDVEVQRFSFTSSGLFGIPGRMYLFGLPFVVAYVSYVAARNPSPQTIQLNRLVWAEYVVASAFSGFKGSLAQVLIHWLLIRSMFGRPISIRVLWRPVYIAVALAAILFGTLIAQRYPSLDLAESGGTAGYLAARSTVIAAAPGALAVRTLEEHPTGFYHVDDLAYFARKYFGIVVLDREVFPFEKIISAQLTGTDLEEDEFVVSVTIGGFAGFLVDFGLCVAVSLMLILGLAYGRVRRRAELSAGAFQFAALATLLRAFDTIVLNGGVVYYVLNVTIMLLILFVFYSVSVAITRTTESSADD